MFLVKTMKLALKIHRPLVQYGDRTPAAQFAVSETDSEFQTTNACVTVSLLSAGVIYGDSSTALFRRGGGRRELFPCSCEGARGSAFTQPADSKAGSGNRPTIV